MVKCDFGPEVTFLGKLICKTNYNHGTLAPAAVPDCTGCTPAQLNLAHLGCATAQLGPTAYGRTRSRSTAVLNLVPYFRAQYMY